MGGIIKLTSEEKDVLCLISDFPDVAEEEKMRLRREGSGGISTLYGHLSHSMPYMDGVKIINVLYSLETKGMIYRDDLGDTENVCLTEDADQYLE